MTVLDSGVVDLGVLVMVSSSPCPVEGPVRSRALSFTVIVAQEFDCQLLDISPFLFADVEDATCPEDFLADIVKAAHPVRSIATSVAGTMKRWFSENEEEVGASEFRVKFRAGLDAGNWRRHGEELIRNLAEHDQPVLLVIDELPIFLKRMRLHEDGAVRVEEFLSWLRSVVQGFDNRSPVLIVSGSIGLAPLVRRLRIADRVNHLDPFRLGPWSREISVACFECLAQSNGLQMEDGVSQAVFDTLGLGIPHHVQTFFARLREFALMQGHNRVAVDDVETVYRTSLLGPAGQNDLVHYTKPGSRTGWTTRDFPWPWRSSPRHPLRTCLFLLHDAVLKSCMPRL